MPAADPHPAFEEAGSALNVDPLMLRAIAQVESGGAKDPDRAVSSAGALGRMQVMPPNLKHYNVTDPSDPRQNIHAGAALLDEALTAANGNVPMALRIYQGGPDQSKWGPQNAAYPGKVAAAYQALTKASPKAGKAAAAPDATDDFLSGGAGPGAAKATPAAPDETDVFLAGKEDAKPADVGSKQFPPETAETRRIGDLMTPGPPTASVTEPQPGVNIPGVSGPPPGLNLGEVGRAAKEGYDSGAVFTPEAIRSFDHAHWGFLPRGVNMLGGIAGGLYGGARDLVGQAADSVLPGAGRDAATGLDLASPFVTSGAASGPRINILAEKAARAANEAVKLDRVAPLSSEFKANPIAPGAENKLAEAARNPPPGDAIPTMTVRPGMGGPEPAPGPQSVGAAASRDNSPPGAIEMTTAEMKANRRQAEKAEILRPPEAGDTTIYVPGSLPTMAEYSGDPVISQKENLLRQRNPNAFEGKDGRLTDSVAGRIRLYEDMTPSDTALQRMQVDRAKQAETDNAAIIQHAKPADAQPALDALDGVLNDKRNMNRDSVQKNLGGYRDRLFDAEAKLKTDPQELWGIRDDLTEKLDKIGSDPQSTMGYVKKETLAFRNAIDGVLNAATDGHFQKFLDNYAAKSQEINAGNLLREYRDKFTNGKGEIQAQRFHKFVLDLAEHRGDPGIDPAMDIPDTTMRRLIAIDHDLKRTGQIDLGKARGSPTDLYGTVAKGMGIVGAHVGAAVTHPGIGNLIVHQALKSGEGALGTWRIKSQTKKHLAPPPDGYRNYLIDPD